MADAVARAVDVLNEALERDPEAITRLVNLRVACNERLARHPTIRTAGPEEASRIGILGLLNGALSDSAAGVIGAQGQRDPDTGLFRRIKRFVDLRADKLDVLT